jgi:hypothetical protein
VGWEANKQNALNVVKRLLTKELSLGFVTVVDSEVKLQNVLSAVKKLSIKEKQHMYVASVDLVLRKTHV